MRQIEYDEALIVGVSLMSGVMSLHTETPIASNTMTYFTMLVKRAFPDKHEVSIALDIQEKFYQMRDLARETHAKT